MGESAMSIENELVRFVCSTAYEDLKPEPLGPINDQIDTEAFPYPPADKSIDPELP
jgi:hypothetical protein